MLSLLSRARIPPRYFNKSIFYRSHHSATGRFMTMDPRGSLVTREIEVWLGDSGDAYVMFDPEISRSFQRDTIPPDDLSSAQDQELYPLTFHHDTRHFSHESTPYPRLEIPQDLPQQSNFHTSQATLHAYGVMHAITLDGTPDSEFHHSIRESMQRLKLVLDELKDT